MRIGIIYEEGEIMERLSIKDYESLPNVLKPKELKRILAYSEPTMYNLLNRTGCPKVYTAQGLML